MRNRLIVGTFILSLALGCDTSERGADTASSVPGSKVSRGYETPSEAVWAFHEGIAEHDLEKVKSAAVLNNLVLPYLEANVRVFEAWDAFAATDAEYFGEEGAMPIGLMGKQTLAALEGIQLEQIDESYATFAVNANSPLKLRKVAEGGWKVDFTGPEYGEFLAASTEALQRTERMMVEVRSGIKDGTLKTRAESREEMKRLKSKYEL